MARAALTVTDVTRTGVLQPAQQAADNVNGNTIPANDGRIVVEVNNTSGGSLVVTFEIPGQIDGVAVANSGKQVTVAAAGVQLVGPFPPALYNQPDGSVYIDTTANTIKFRTYHLP